jgi:outer membrane protein OmpA-like peptidoglycan-associated protein
MKKTFILFVLFFAFNINAQNITLDISVVNEYSKENISLANVKLVNLTTNQILRKKTNFNGELKLNIKPDMRYKLMLSSESDSNIVIFKENKLDFKTEGISGGATIKRKVKVRPIFQKKGIKFLEDINFGIFTYNLDKIAVAKLDNIIAVMEANREINIEVYGYASCNLGADDANSVSGERAKITFTYLTDTGIDYTRIIAGALGKKNQITKCTCEAEKKKNKPCTKKHHLINSRVGFVFN